MPLSDNRSNTLGNVSLGLGILATTSIFCLGVTALTSAQQGWINLVGVPLWVCSATSAFLGLIALILGAVGIFTAAGRSRAVAISGAVLGLLAICLFAGVLAALNGG